MCENIKDEANGIFTRENGNDINILYIVKELIIVASKNLAGLSELWPCTFDHLQRLTNTIIIHK